MPLPQTNNSDWPESHDTVRFIVRSEPDRHGRQTFFALFWRDGQRKLLGYVGADLNKHVNRARAEESVIEVVARFGDLREAA